MIVTLAGHVDHGKTALVKALTGIDTDRLEEEKRRGLTIDLGFAYHDFANRRVGFVDVPGHHRFIHNMIAGIASKQYALFVVAADDGVMPQTREHLNILQLLGLRSGIVVVNKIDIVDLRRVDEVIAQIQTLVQSTFLSGCPIVKTSTTTNEGIEELSQKLADAAGGLERKHSNRATRIAIDRSFSPRGQGSVVTGTIFDGSISVGDQLEITLSKQLVRIRSLVTNGIPSDNAVAGDRVGIQLAGESFTNISRGFWLRDAQSAVRTQRCTLQLHVLKEFPRALGQWSQKHIYHATSHSLARVFPLDSSLYPGNEGLIDIECEIPMDLAVGDRLILRDQDLQCTVGGGTVLETVPLFKRRRSKSRLSYLRQLTQFVEQERPLDALARVCNVRCISINHFRTSWNLTIEETSKIVSSGEFKEINGRLLSKNHLESLLSATSTFLGQFHRENPREFGATLEIIADAGKIDQETAKFVLTCGVQMKLYQTHTRRYALVTHTVEAPKFNKSLYEQLLPLIDSNQPSSTGDIAKALKIPLRQLESEMKRMAAANVLVPVTNKRYFTPEQLTELATLADRIGVQSPFSVRDFRDASGLGRTLVIDVLEYFDQLRFTKRTENHRTVIGSVESLNFR